MLLFVFLLGGCSKASDDSHVAWMEKEASDAQQTSTNTKWMCSLCNTLYVRSSILYTFDVRICPGCGNLQMNKGSHWIWDKEGELVEGATAKELDMKVFGSSSGVYEHPDMPLGGKKEEILQTIGLDISKAEEVANGGNNTFSKF